jgi:hypothetical protein
MAGKCRFAQYLSVQLPSSDTEDFVRRYARYWSLCYKYSSFFDMTVMFRREQKLSTDTTVNNVSMIATSGVGHGQLCS